MDFGVCGRANRPCKIAHSSTYPNKVGVYPSEFLPSTFTIWHAVFATNFPPQIIESSFIPGAIGGLIGPAAQAAGLLGFPGPIIHTWQSHHNIIFARTANRFNVAYTLTEDDVNNADGTSEIDVGEYVFEVVAVTDDLIAVNNGLTEQEAEGLEDAEECNDACSFESQDDREFRKLFEMRLENATGKSLTNRFLGIVPNTSGIEYRMDNGTAKSRLALDQSGIGDLDNISDRDGSSRKLQVQLGTEGDALVAGDVIFLTYVAVKEHYIRQRVNISWQTIDPGDVSQCISLFLGFSIVHYRFYEWDMDGSPGSPPQKLAGWRAVESFSSDVNFVAPVISGGETLLADFPIGGPDSFGISTFDYLPGSISISELNAFQADRGTLPTYNVNLNGRVPQGGAFHNNTGAESNNTAFRNSEWFQRNQFSKFLSQTDASDHVFFNVHPKALRKRDVDKFGIEKFLAIELEKDMNAGKITFFPFMDDPNIDNPTELDTSSPMSFLDNSNALFEPILPVTAYGGNFEADCQSLGTFPTNPADGINTYHSFESNRITEKFETDTRLLVERNFAVGPSATKFGTLGPRLITIEGAGGSQGTVTCLADPSGEFAFAGHINDDGFMIYNSFSNGYTEKAIRSLVFRPDLEPPPFKDNSTPSVDQFESLVGFSGMIGDMPGIQPGRAISISSAAQTSSFTIHTTQDERNFRLENPSLADSEINEINLPDAKSSPMVVTVSNSYHGAIRIEYKLDEAATSKDSEVLLLAKLGSDISGIIDGLAIDGSSSFIQVDFRWIRASSFELIGPRVEDMTVTKITTRSISTDKLNDFLNEQSSHTSSFSEASSDDRLTERSLFFGTDVVTMSEDENSNLYVFFNDADGGISAVGSNNFGGSWTYHYGIVEKINNFEAKNPFAVTNYPSNNGYIFFQFGGKILCKKIQFSLFNDRDGNLISRFNSDVLVLGSEDQLPFENQSIFTESGQILRQKTLSYVAAGDLTDNTFREITGKVPGEFEYKPLEQRESANGAITARKNPVVIAPSTAFTNANVNDIFFSAYRNDKGTLRLWFMSAAQNAEIQLQCHFSTDDGRSWYDLWEFMEFGHNRFRFDSDKNTQFIDRNADVTLPATLEAVDPEESSQQSVFGINVHWSRLKKHKIGEGETTIDSESQTLEISSPYAFYQSTTDRVFLFYIYEGCLLCKIFNDELFSESAKLRNDSDNDGMAAIKKVIERETRSHFVDGSLASTALREELHRFPNESTQEVMAEGNIIFRYPFAVDNFVDNRTIPSQRVCAYDLPSGATRVFYKHADSINLKSALWNGSEWWAEDFMRDPGNVGKLVIPDEDDFTEVTGGFGGSGFSP